MRSRATAVFASRVQCLAVVLVALAGSAAQAQAPYPAETNLRFEVWDGGQWTNQVNAHPGDRIEWRAVISYVGTRTDVQGLAECLFQPIIPNADNDGPIMDEIGPWRNGGVTGNVMSGFDLPSTMLSVAEGEYGGPLTSYGRVRFGAIASTETGSNILSTFRHAGGSGGAPDGSWIRLAGNFVSIWPVAGDGSNWSAADSNWLLRGISIAQESHTHPSFSGGVNPYWRGGTQDVVIFRQAIIIGDIAAERTLEITAAESAFRRAAMQPNTTDNRRYVSWYTEDYQSFSAAYRASLSTITSARAIVTVPAPAVWAGIFIHGCIRRYRRR